MLYTYNMKKKVTAHLAEIYTHIHFTGVFYMEKKVTFCIHVDI